MTATTLAWPVPAQAARGPRLLLPPRAEPAAQPVGPAALGVPELRSVLSPLTDRPWPFGGSPAAPAPPDLPEPGQVCGSLVVAAVEVLRCVRPLSQLARWVSPAVYEALAAAASPSTGPRGRAVVRRLRVCRVSPTVAEASVVVHDGARVRAAAVRLEVHRGSWRATVLQIG